MVIILCAVSFRLLKSTKCFVKLRNKLKERTIGGSGSGHSKLLDIEESDSLESIGLVEHPHFGELSYAENPPIQPNIILAEIQLWCGANF